ncbi:MAG: TIGR01244 family phosphatase [Alphaproteobacteria bacterium]|nr:TIGR01244 family phosphatase [Alphaproteobacteria bacterium]
MKPIKQITPEFSVTGQVGLADLSTLAGLGFKTVINNRPDGEEPGQPTNAEIAAEAKKHNLAYLHIPVVSGRMTQDNVEDFKQYLPKSTGPVVAFCRSGTRCATLWALAQAGKMNADDILNKTSAAGFDLSGLRPVLEK